MTPMGLINEAFENSERFTVNIWLRGGGELRNVNLLRPRNHNTHLHGAFQETGNQISIDFSEIAALEIDE